MDVQQIMRQLADVAQRITWSDSEFPNETVFAGVAVVAGDVERMAQPPALPALWLQPLETRGSSGTSGGRGNHAAGPSVGNETGLQVLSVRVHIWGGRRLDARQQEGWASRRVQSLGWSRVGLAVLSLQAELAFSTLTAADGLDMSELVRVVSGPHYHAAPSRDQAGPIRASFDLLAFISGSPSFPAPRSLTAEPGGSSGTIALSWTLPGRRYDHLGVMLRRSFGGAPSGPEDGEAVYVGTNGSAVDTDLPSGEAAHYRLWTRYDAAVPGSTRPAVILSSGSRVASAVAAE